MKKYVYLVSFHLNLMDRETIVSPFYRTDFTLDRPLTEKEVVRELEEKVVSWYKSSGVRLYGVTFLNALLLRVEGEDKLKQSQEDRYVVVQLLDDGKAPMLKTPAMTHEECCGHLLSYDWYRKGKDDSPQACWFHPNNPKAKAYTLIVPRF